MEKNLVSTETKVRKLTTFAMLTAISVILGFTPLGFIPIPPVGATIMHIPVIITAILEGPVLGAFMGLIFGIISLINAMIKPGPLSFAALNPMISIFPRIFIGLVAYYAYKSIPLKNENIRIGISAAIGTLINTIGFLGMMYLFYAPRVADALEIGIYAVRSTLLTIGVTQGLPEAVVAVIITVPIIIVIKKIRR